MLLVDGIIYGLIDKKQRTIDGVSMVQVFLMPGVEAIHNCEDRKCNALQFCRGIVSLPPTGENPTDVVTVERFTIR